MPDEAKRKTVKVGCLVPNGVELRLFRKGEDDGTGSGYRPIIPDLDAPSVTLRGPHGLGMGANAMTAEPEINEGIDAGFFDTWLKANEKNTLVQKGLIFLVKEDEGEQGER